MAISRSLLLSAALGIALADDFLSPRSGFEVSNSSTSGAATSAEDTSERVLQFRGAFQIRWGGQRNTCVDVAGGRDENFNKIQVFECDYPENQMFRYNPRDKMPQIKWDKNPRKCLDVKDGSTSNFADIILYDCHPLDHPDRPHQAFVFDSALSGFPTIRWQPHANKCVDLKDGIVGTQSNHNSKLITYDCHYYFDDSDWIHQKFETRQ